jgi:hypothetical protein
MRPFTFSRAGQPWPPGLTLLHVYVVADLARDRELAALVAGCRGATRGEPLAHVGDAWLHITLCQIAVPAHEVGGDQRAALATRIGQQLAGVAPFAITVGGPFCVPTGVLLGIADGRERLAEVRRLVSAAARTVLGPAAINGDEGTLHMTESYAYGQATDDRIQARIDAVRPRRAAMRVDAVHLVDVAADQQAKAITWAPVAAVALPGSATGGSATGGSATGENR